MMIRLLWLGLSLWLAAPLAVAQETDASTETAAAAPAAEPNGDGMEAPKSMSGMSILGNEEAPKALVIIPWKSSELGDDVKLEESLDGRARPVDKEVFLRELQFHAIREGEDVIREGESNE